MIACYAGSDLIDQAFFFVGEFRAGKAGVNGFVEKVPLLDITQDVAGKGTDGMGEFIVYKPCPPIVLSFLPLEDGC